MAGKDKPTTQGGNNSSYKVTIKDRGKTKRQPRPATSDYRSLS